MKPRRVHSETRSSIRSRRRRFAGCSLDMGCRASCGRALYGASRGPASRSRKRSLRSSTPTWKRWKRPTTWRASASRARGQDQAIELRDVERERAIERAQRAQVHRNDAAAPRGARAAHGPAVGDVEAHRLLVRELAAAADAAPQLRAQAQRVERAQLEDRAQRGVGPMRRDRLERVEREAEQALHVAPRAALGREPVEQLEQVAAEREARGVAAQRRVVAHEHRLLEAADRRAAAAVQRHAQVIEQVERAREALACCGALPSRSP